MGIIPTITAIWRIIMIDEKRIKVIDKDRIKAAVTEILEAIGEDPNREGLADTPDRVARICEEIFAGLNQDPRDVIKVFSEDGHEEIVMVKDIPLYSVCEHHLLPFIGVAHVVYIPNKGKIVGLSKLARVVDIVAKRPQLQERLTSEIADVIMETVQPHGVAVVVEAEHLCMTMRGVRKPGSKTVTSALRGIVRTQAKTRSEIMSLIRG
jgi:GTP cyclohydrolase I